VQLRPFIERCPHSASVGAAAATGSAGWVVADRSTGLAGFEAVLVLADLAL
jgi:hypothetical protein